MSAPVLLVPSPYGEVVDRIVILELKVARLGDPVRAAEAGRLREALVAHWVAAGLPELETLPEIEPLRELNAALWDVEDALRAHETKGDFGEVFVSLARRVYGANDARAAAKRAIDRRLGSPFHEPKSHT